MEFSDSRWVSGFPGFHGVLTIMEYLISNMKMKRVDKEMKSHLSSFLFSSFCITTGSNFLTKYESIVWIYLGVLIFVFFVGISFDVGLFFVGVLH